MATTLLLDELVAVGKGEGLGRGRSAGEASLLGISAFVVLELLACAEEDETCTDFYRRVIEPHIWDTPSPHSLAAVLPQQHRRSQHSLVAKATCYVIFPRESSISELLRAILFFAKHHPDHYFWVDMFSSSPEETQLLTRSFLLHTLPDRIASIGCALLLESDLDDAVSLKRQWCLWELMCVSDANLPLYLAELSDGREAFAFELSEKFFRIISRVIRVCWDDAESTVRNDSFVFSCVHRSQSCVDQRIAQILTPAVAQYTKDIAAEKGEELDSVLQAWIVLQLMEGDEESAEQMCAQLQSTPEALATKDMVGRNLLYHACLLLRHPSRHAALHRVITTIIQVAPESVKVPIDSGWVPLYSALSSSSPLSIVRLLVDADPESVRTPNKQGDWYPLHVAVANQAPLEVVEYLISLFPEAVRFLTNTKSSLLHFALRNCASHDVVKLLLHHSPEAVSVENKNGWLPIHEAVFCDTPLETVRLLVEANKASLWTRTSLKWLPAHVIVSDSFHEDVFDYLLEVYPDAVKQDDGDGWYLLHALASSHAPLSCLRKVYNMHPEVVKLRNADGKLPLHLAITDGCSPDAVEFLISVFPEALHSMSFLGRKALHLAAATSDPRIVAIVHKGAPEVLDDQCSSRRTPLLWSCTALARDPERANSNFETFKYLWEASKKPYLR